jgi:hypothetical protein
MQNTKALISTLALLLLAVPLAAAQAGVSEITIVGSPSAKNPAYQIKIQPDGTGVYTTDASAGSVTLPSDMGESLQKSVQAALPFNEKLASGHCAKPDSFGAITLTYGNETTSQIGCHDNPVSMRLYGEIHVIDLFSRQVGVPPSHN